MKVAESGKHVFLLCYLSSEESGVARKHRGRTRVREFLCEEQSRKQVTLTSFDVNMLSAVARSPEYLSNEMFSRAVQPATFSTSRRKNNNRMESEARGRGKMNDLLGKLYIAFYNGENVKISPAPRLRGSFDALNFRGTCSPPESLTTCFRPRYHRFRERKRPAAAVAYMERRERGVTYTEYFGDVEIRVNRFFGRNSRIDRRGRAGRTLRPRKLSPGARGWHRTKMTISFWHMYTGEAGNK